MSMSEYIKHARHFDGLGMGDHELEQMARQLEDEIATLKPPFEKWMREAGLGSARAENEKLKARIAELEKERDQWQESSGQNYVRAQEAEAREEELREAVVAIDRAFKTPDMDAFLRGYLSPSMRLAIENASRVLES